MSRRAIRFWYLLHKWSGIVPTAFLLMLCLTGLPLIFHDEIDALMASDAEAALAGAPSASSGLPLDAILDQALADRPGEVPLFMAFSQDSPLLTVTTGPSPDAAGGDMTLLFFDRATGEALGPAPVNAPMDFLLQLHTDMFLGQGGMWALGVCGILLVVALISGVVLYAPFMRRLPFGTNRTDRSARVRRLDQHNLVGIIALGWMLVIALTGAINAFADPLTENWRDGEVARLTAQYGEAAPVAPEEYASLDAALATAQDALPGRSPQFIAFPGGDWSSARHYAIFFQGDRPVTQHLLTPALVDAGSGAFVDARTMPALNQALMMSKPLHFGDYGGLPLKIVWALLTIATIWVLWTGLALWLRRRPGAIERRIEEIRSGGRRQALA
ncbi:PepSY domain-containing protein [Erythrobacter litoralis]|uniref:PepSY-associated TM helix domain-containing protein n=1 Tax=Erythrobacter litoralis TaxID=39960 RepID=UPI0024355E18|nr:PepSY-associated TM helix domain-containing protein [Erythrobacter litoralis]MDG6077879.1 PepSY domain-containing protein [Erythrobacter litoralis]